ncbi:MAG: NAD(P)/FAD-dependent oxidoreductase [Pyrinomonadaceae bacterium]
MKSYDVVIIGAGLAGLEASRRLADLGRAVLLVDRKASLDQSIHTTGIFVRRTLEDFSLPEDCLGPPVRNVRLYSPGRRWLDLSSPHDEFRIGRMGLLYQRLLNRSVSSGVEFRPSNQFIGCAKTTGGLAVRVESGNGSRSIQTRYLVGADGANSRVAAALGLEENREWIVGVEEVVENVPLDGPPRFHCFLDPAIAPGYLAWAVHDGQQVHIGVGGYVSKFDPLKALKQFRESLEDILDLRSARFVERRGGRIPVGGVLRNIANAEGLLVGDAAGAVSPLTAGGLDPCLRLSACAAVTIADYLQSRDARRLASYSGDLFRARFVSRLFMRRAIAVVHSPALLEVGCALLRLPIFYSIAWQIFFGRGSFPDFEAGPSPERDWRRVAA